MNRAGALKPRLLFVDGDAGRIALFSRWLEGTKFALVPARSGGQAIGMLSREFGGAVGAMLDHNLSDAPLHALN